MSNLLVFLLGILVSFPSGFSGDTESVVTKRVRGEMGSEVEVSLKMSGAGAAKPGVVLTLRNLETDVAVVGGVRFVIPEPEVWKKVSAGERVKPPRIRFRLELDEDALLDSLQYLSAGMVVEGVELGRKSIAIRGSVSVGTGYPVPVGLEGRPKIRGDCLSLEVKRASVFDIRLPASMAGIFSGVAPMLLDLEEMDIDYFIAEEADEALETDFRPVIRKWELKKGMLVVSGYYRAERQ
ncbi:MAG: hypothetical protein ABIH66_09940 [bacterium]